ncbi:MAG: hypothetical protein ACQETK_03220 [Pseudomonadota bacterium]
MQSIRTMRGFWRSFVLVTVVALSTFAQAAIADEYRPFILAYTTTGTDVRGEAEAVRERLEEAGFETLGEYPVSDARHVVVVTHDDLLRVAGTDARAGYLAPIRVGITRVNGDLQVSYNNLEYFRHAYRVDDPVATISGRLEQVLGAQRDFGSDDGMSPRDLSRYRYAFGMERFDRPYELGSFNSRREALAELDDNLAQRAGGVSEIYRVDIPGQDVTVIGVAIREADGADSDAADRFTLETVDVRDHRHTAYVPYEILVRGGEIEALHMRFRAALHWPDLSMLGANSFMKLRRSPGAIEEALQEVAGFEEEHTIDW